MHVKLNRGSALTAGLVVITFGTLTLATVSSMWVMQPEVSPTPSPRSPDHPEALLGARLGLDATALTAAGVSTNALPAVATALTIFWNEHGTTLSTKDEAIRADRDKVQQLTKKKTRGQINEAERSDLAASQQRLGPAMAARDALLNTAFQSATSGFTSEQVAIVTSIKRNRSWPLPVELLTVDRAPHEWVALQGASAPRYQRPEGAPGFPIAGDGVTLPSPNTSSTTDPMADAMANPTVAAAASRLQNNREAMETAWKSIFMSKP